MKMGARREGGREEDAYGSEKGRLEGGRLNTNSCNFSMLIYTHIPTNGGHVGPANVCIVIGISFQSIP